MVWYWYLFANALYFLLKTMLFRVPHTLLSVIYVVARTMHSREVNGNIHCMQFEGPHRRLITSLQRRCAGS